MRKIFVLAVATILVTLVLIPLGGYVRQSGSGLACPDWPLCYGQLGPPLDQEGTLIEFSHRMVALVVSLLALGVGIIAIRHRRESGFILKAAIVAGVGIVAQVGLGAAVVLVELQPFLIMAHLAMAFGFLATMIIISLAAQRASQPSPEVLPTASAGEKALLIGTLASLIALLLTGAFAGGSGAGMGCQGWPLCNDQFIPGGDFAAKWQVWIIYAHRLLTISTAGLVFVLAWRWRRHEVPAVRKTAIQAAILMIVQIGLGAFNPLFLIPVAVAVAHLAVAAIIWTHVVVVAALSLDLLPSTSMKAPSPR